MADGKEKPSAWRQILGVLSELIRAPKAWNPEPPADPQWLRSDITLDSLSLARDWANVAGDLDRVYATLELEPLRLPGALADRNDAVYQYHRPVVSERRIERGDYERMRDRLLDAWESTLRDVSAQELGATLDRNAVSTARSLPEEPVASPPPEERWQVVDDSVIEARLSSLGIDVDVEARGDRMRLELSRVEMERLAEYITRRRSGL